MQKTRFGDLKTQQLGGKIKILFLTKCLYYQMNSQELV